MRRARSSALALVLLLAAASAAPAQAVELPPIPDSIPSTFGPIAVEREAPTSCPSHALGCFDRLTRRLVVDGRVGGIMAWRILEHERVHVWLWDANVGFASEEQEDRFANVIANARVAQMLAELRARGTAAAVTQAGAPRPPGGLAPSPPSP